jgi:phosphinothricin acetyltransferase
MFFIWVGELSYSPTRFVLQYFHKKGNIMLRIATVEDAEAILDIYQYYILNTAITYEYEVPSIEEFRGRIQNTLEQYPYLVCERDGEIVGYAYASRLHPRAAYDYSAESSIYVRHGLTKGGVGKELNEALESILKMQHVQTIAACIATPEEPDSHLNRNSVEYHTHMGYRMIGEFKRCAYKFHTWYNMVWMEKWLDAHEGEPAPFVPFPEIKKEVEKLL